MCFKVIFYLLFPIIFFQFQLTFSDIIEVYAENKLEGNYSSLEDAFSTNIYSEKTFLVSCLKSCEIFQEKKFSNRSTIIGKDTRQIIWLHSTIIIQNFLNLTNMVVSSQFNSSVLWKILENGTFICFKCDFTNIGAYLPFIFFESYKASFFCDQCNFFEIENPNLKLFFNATFSFLAFTKTVFQAINSDESFLYGYSSSIFILNALFYNLKFGNINMECDPFLQLINSALNFVNNSLNSCNFYSAYFLSIQYDFNFGIKNSLIMIKQTNFNVLTLTHSFIFISDASALYLNAQNLLFQQIRLDGPLFYLKNVNKSFLNNIEVWGISSNQFLNIYDSDFIILQNLFLNSTNTYYGESIIYFKNTIEKIINNLTLINSRNYLTTPGIKIIERNQNTNSKTLINNSFFSNNSINYSTNDDIGSVFFVSSENEELVIENSIFLKNNLVPAIGFSDIKIGGACLRATGKNIQIFIKNSIFNGNTAVFDSNCIQFNGNILLIVESYFLANINSIKPLYKSIVDTFGYGGTIYAICQNLTIKNSSFIENMNYYGGNIYYYGSPHNQTTDLLINNSIFIDNYAHTFGACLYINNQIEIMNAYFVNSLPYFNWGNFNANVFLNYDSREAVITFENDFFIEGWSDYTPSIDFECISGVAYITNCSFFNNTANWLPRSKTKYFYDNIISNYACAGVIGINTKAGNSALYIFSKSNVFMDNMAVLKGGVIGMTGGNFLDENSLFYRNYAQSAGTFYMHIKSFMNLTNTTVIESYASGSVSSLLIREFSYLYINKCIFKNSLSNGVGLISIEGDCEVHIGNSVFSNISSSTGSILYSRFVSNDFSIILSNNIFINNSNSKSMEMFFFKESFNILFCNNILKNNLNTVFTVIHAKIFFSQNLYENIACSLSQFGCIMQLSLNSSVQIVKENILKISSFSGFAFDFSNSRINISNSNLQSIQVSRSTGFLFHSSMSQINMSNISMINFFPGGIETYTSTVFLVDQCFFLKNSSKNLLFETKETPVISAFNSLNFLILNSFFTGNYYSHKGGVIFLKCDVLCFNNINYVIKFCTFIDNKVNDIGGVIYCENSNLIMIGNSFVNNSATQAGGVIYFNGTSQLYLMNNRFINNFGWEGGAVKYTDTSPIIRDDNIFLNNTAFYGPNFASYPIRFSIKEILNQLKEPELILIKKPSNLVSAFQNFSINLLDNLNQTVSTINNSFILIDLKSNFSSKYGLKGETRIPILRGGVFFNRTFFYSNLSHQTLNFEITCTKIQLYKHIDIKLSNNEKIIDNQYIFVIPLKIKDCSLGEYFDENLLFCLPCPRGTFSFTLNAEKCDLCPNEADFCSDSRIFLQNGYWRSNIYSFHIYQCTPNEESCLGGYDSACDIGYNGPLCQSCESQYTKVYGNQCSLCLNNYSIQIIQLVFGSLALIAFYIYIIRGNLKLNENFKFDKDGNLSQQSYEDFYSTIYNKILVDYFQMVSFVKGINLNWSQLVSIYFQVDFYLGNAPGYIFSFDCLITDSFYIKPLYLQMILFSLLPFFSIFLLLCFWFWRSKKTGDIDNGVFWQKYTTSELVLLNILQPTIVNAMMKLITCREIDGTFYIVNYYNYECSNQENIRYIAILTIPTLFTWGFIYQLINLARLLKNRRFLSSEKVRKKCGVLYNFYRKKYFYWEFVEIYKKYVLIFLITYMQVHPEIKCLIVILFIYLLCGIIRYLKPFINQEINDLSILAHIVIIATILFGLFSFETTGTVQFLGNCIIFSINFLFLVYYYLKILWVKKAQIRSFLKKMRFLKGFLFQKKTKCSSKKIFGKS